MPIENNYLFKKKHCVRFCLHKLNSNSLLYFRKDQSIRFNSTVRKTKWNEKKLGQNDSVWDKISSQTFNIALYLTGICILMLGFSYASVPLYQLYCQATGLGGISVLSEKDPDQIDLSEKDSFSEKTDDTLGERVLTVEFNSETSDNMPWTFKPTVSRMRVYPGDTALTFYMAENKTDEPVSGISTYNVMPQKAGTYFNKIQCFCFEEQRLKPHESIEMPILFFIDSDFLEDPKMKDVSTITLSYTFYRCS